VSGAHVFYIPLILFVGLAVGWVMGKRQADKEAAGHNRTQETRSERAERRRQRRSSSDDAA
jgi:hypothetical protein